MKTEEIFKENNRNIMCEKISSSGKYRLQISKFETGPGYFAHTQGKVFNEETGNVISVVNRNYGAFPFAFVENHKNGHDYLICGENYQGQTVIELDTGLRKEYLHEDAKQGMGFCFAGMEPNSVGDLLIVDGCYWACPYEVRVYDFSDPLNTLNEIEYAENNPEFYNFTNASFQEDGNILFECLREIETENDDDDITYETVQRGVFKVENSQLLLLESWTDPQVIEQRAQAAAANARWKEEVKKFEENNELFLEIKKRFPDARLSVGYTYADWHPSEKFDEQRAVVELIRTKKKIISIDFGFTSAPIKYECYSPDENGKLTHQGARFYDLTLENMKTVLDEAERFINE